MTALRQILSGDKFNMLTVIKMASDQIDKYDGRIVRRFFCMCDCGRQTVVRQSRLVSGKTKSCGCLRSVQARKPKPHLKSKNNWTQKEYKSYFYFRKKHLAEFCQEWVEGGYARFKEDMGTRPKGKIIQRRNPDKPYSKENCLWADRASVARKRFSRKCP